MISSNATTKQTTNQISSAIERGQAQSQPRRSAWRRLADSRLANAMAAPHGMGRYLEAVNPMWALDTQRIRARVTGIQRETADAVTVQLRSNGEWTGFKAGQFMQFTVEIDGRQVSRCYSFSAAQSGKAASRDLQITVKAHADGWVSKYINESLGVGDLVTLSPAMGEFVLPEQLPEQLLFIAGGSGITPLKCMVEQLLNDAYAGQITLLYYNRSEADSIFLDRLRELQSQHENFQLICCNEHAEPDQATPLQGYFAPEHLAFAGVALSQKDWPLSYVCGPAGLMDAVSESYAAAGQSTQLKQERFSSPVSAQASAGDADTASGELRFSQSERYVSNDGRSLLDQAEAIGLTPQAGCRMGICHTCTCTKSSGTVRNLQTGELSHGEESIRICVSQAVGDVTLAL